MMETLKILRRKLPFLQLQPRRRKQANATINNFLPLLIVIVLLITVLGVTRCTGLVIVDPGSNINGTETNHTIYRDILHREISRINSNNDKNTSSNLQAEDKLISNRHGENVGGNSPKDSQDSSEGVVSVSSSHLHVNVNDKKGESNKEQNKLHNNNNPCEDCTVEEDVAVTVEMDEGDGEGSKIPELHIGNVDPEDVNDTEKIEEILRDIFQDELGDEGEIESDQDPDDNLDGDSGIPTEVDAAGENEGEEEDEVSRSSLPALLSRHVRASEDGGNETFLSFFPEGRGFPPSSSSSGEGKGMNKGTRASPGKKNGGDNPSKSRSKGKNKKKPAADSSSSGSIDLKKYNEYMDAVFGRMNVLIKKKRMDPLRVNLYAGPNKQPGGGGGGGTAKKKNNNNTGDKKKRNKNNSNKKSSSKKHSPRMDSLDADEEQEDDRDGEGQEDPQRGPARKNIFLQRKGHSQPHHQEDGNKGHENEDNEEEDEEPYVETVRKIRALLNSADNSNSTQPSKIDALIPDEGPRGNGNGHGGHKPKKPKNKNSSNNKDNKAGRNKNKNKKNSGTENENGSSNANAKPSKKPGGGGGNKKSKPNSKPKQNNKPARGVLHGLSSLRRDGNVAVIKQGNKARLIRANFILGPVSLEILPKKTKTSSSPSSESSSSSKGSATATASKLRGILEVRLKKGGPTRIRRLRVYPPKSVKVDGGSSSSSSSSSSKRKPQQYGKVTPMATARLRQVANTVVRQTDSKKVKP